MRPASYEASCEVLCMFEETDKIDDTQVIFVICSMIALIKHKMI